MPEIQLHSADLINKILGNYGLPSIVCSQVAMAESTSPSTSVSKAPVFQRLKKLIHRQSSVDSGLCVTPSGGLERNHSVLDQHRNGHRISVYPALRSATQNPRGTPPLAAFCSDEDIASSQSDEFGRGYSVQPSPVGVCKSAPNTPSLQVKHRANPLSPQPKTSTPHIEDKIFRFFSQPFWKSKSGTEENSVIEAKSKEKNTSSRPSPKNPLLRTLSQKYIRTKECSESSTPQESPVHTPEMFKLKTKKNKRRHFTVEVGNLNFSLFHGKETSAGNDGYSKSAECDEIISVSPVSVNDVPVSLQSGTSQSSGTRGPLCSDNPNRFPQSFSPQTNNNGSLHSVQSRSTQTTPDSSYLSPSPQHYSWPTNTNMPPRVDNQGLAISFFAVGSTDSGIQSDTASSSHDFSQGVAKCLDPVKTVPSNRLHYHDNNEAPSTERPLSAYDNVTYPEPTPEPPPTQTSENTSSILRHSSKHRARSDLGGRRAIREAVYQDETSPHLDSIATLCNSGQAKAPSDTCRKSRRRSTPHPIKVRKGRSLMNKPDMQHRLKRCSSAPDVAKDDPLNMRPKSMMPTIINNRLAPPPGPLDRLPASTEHLNETFSLTLSFTERSDTTSLGSDRSPLNDEMFDREISTYAEALWDHVTLDEDELAFSVGDQILVLDVTDRDWWWGMKGEQEGWFPAAFVRLKANQEETAEDFAQKVKEGRLDSDAAMRRYSVNMLSRDQARTNVVNEILQAEQEYVKHLKDVVEGYIEKASRRTDMFTEEQIFKIFGNIEEIYTFAQSFLQDLQRSFSKSSPHSSELGQCFINHSKGFEIYSDYCNNHPLACELLDSLQQVTKYQHFFEACRLLQDMIEIPLEGFLLIPVQKICKYPLQLAELLKYTSPSHPDHSKLHAALDTMKHIAVFINERKRKMECVEKLVLWQNNVDQWEGADLLEQSSELIHQGELSKVNSNGWHQERMFFLFDHQLIYCKKDLLRRDLLGYKGRIDLGQCDILPISDGKDPFFNVNVKNAWKIFDHTKEKWYLLYAKTESEKNAWLEAFEKERRRVKEDIQHGYRLPSYVKQAAMARCMGGHGDKLYKLKSAGRNGRRVSRVPMDYQHPALNRVPSRQRSHPKMTQTDSKKHWFATIGRKFKR